jgi:hypothetical protein
MTIINIEGLGEVEIQGDTPTPEESRIILKAVEAKKQEKIAQDLPSLAETYVTESNLSSGLTPEEVAEQDQALGNYLKSPEFFRLVAEIGGATAGSILTGGLALPAAAVAARAGMLARPFLAKLAKSTAGAAAGGGTAAGAASVTFDPKDDVLKEVVRGATEAAIGEAVGAPIAIKIGQGLTKVLGPKIDLLKGAEEAESIIKEQSAKIKTNPNLYDTELQKAAGDAQLTIGLKADNFFIDTLQNITEKSLLGAGEIVAAKEGAKTIAESAIKDFVDPFIQTADKTSTGKLFQQAISDSQTLWKERMKAGYNTIDKKLAENELTRGALVDMTSYKNLLQKEINSLPLKGVNQPNVKRLLQNNLDSTPDKLTFSEANSLRSDILGMGRDLTATDSARLIGAQKTMAKGITSSLDDTMKLKEFPEEIKKAYQIIQNEYKLGKSDFNEKVLTRLLQKEDPAVIFETIVSKSDKPETIKKTLEVINRRFAAEGKNAEAVALKDSLKGQFLNNVIRKSTIDDPQYGNYISSTSLRKSLDSYAGTTKELFTAGEKAQLDKLVRTLGFAQGTLAKTGSGGLVGGVAIQLKQAGAAASVLSFGGAGYYGGGGLSGGAAAILIGPKVVSKLLLSPSFNKFLIQGLKAPTAGEKAIAFRQLVTKMASEGLIDKDEADEAIENSKIIEKQPVQKQEPRSQVPTAQPVAQATPSLESPPTNIFAANTPGTPMTTGVTPTAQTTQPMDKAQQYAGLFPFDIAGQQIARQG